MLGSTFFYVLLWSNPNAADVRSDEIEIKFLAVRTMGVRQLGAYTWLR